MTEERTEYTVSVELQERLDALWASYGVLATQVRDYWDAIMEAAETIKELKATVQRLEQDNRRLRHLDAMPVGAIVSAMEWCDKTGADESIVNDIADFLATLDGAA